MMDRYPLTLFAMLGIAGISHACDCSIEIPGTLCETMDPQWIEPDIVVLGLKLDEVYYGMRVRVLQVFDGAVTEGDTITVWGDNGALCRWYVNTWANGDTVVWAFNNVDFYGNEITAGYPPDLEQAGDYHISACGTYWLPYANGLVSGGIAPGVTSASVDEFWPAVTACMSTGTVEGKEPAVVSVQHITGGAILSATRLLPMRVVVTDASGRAVLRRDWNGAPLSVPGLSTGAYFARVTSEDRQWMLRFVVDHRR